MNNYMNRKRSGTSKKLLPALICLFLFNSCKNTFDIQPELALEQSQVYRNVYDADAAVLGIYGKFVRLADRYIILNELRGDLLDVTSNANADLKQLSTHTVQAGNQYADPKPFYEVIINCNDALKNFQEMRSKNLLDENQFYQRYTDVGLIRSWLYLQLGIHFGEVPFVTDPITNISDLNDAAKFPKLTFDQLLEKLIEFANTIPAPYLNQNTSAVSPTLLMPMAPYLLKDGVFKFFIHRRSHIGDLYLWKGNYLEAAKWYKAVMETGSNLTSTPDFDIQIYDTYRITNDNSGRNTLMSNGTVNPWKSIFSNLLEESETNRERMWTLPLNKAFAPYNPFINLFSASNDYLLKPSNLAIEHWDNQLRTDGGLTDLRGLDASYRINAGKPEVLKLIPKYNPLTPYEKNGLWILYRAAELHLRYAEAANREGRSELAAALMNDGVKNAFGGKVVTYNGVPDVAPFDFDPTIGSKNGNWYRSIGIRGRALSQNIPFDKANFDVLDVENKLLDEAALETAFEGYRWADLLRIALRREKDAPGSGVTFLNEKIAAKFQASGQGGFKAFTSVKDYYLPF